MVGSILAVVLIVTIVLFVKCRKRLNEDYRQQSYYDKLEKEERKNSESEFVTSSKKSFVRVGIFKTKRVSYIVCQNEELIIIA